MGEQLGRYELINKIAAGGMAEVYRARVVGASGFEKELALKLILPHLAQEREFVEMFIDEAKIASGLTHPNIVQVLELGEIEDRYFIAMELVDGENLYQILRRLRTEGRRLPVPLAVHIAIEALTGLEFAHGATGKDGKRLELIHRDVSPQNIFISKSGHVKVGDFGIAKATGRLTKTEGGAIKGKYRYMSPEQVKNQPLDSRSDLFAMGAILYEMLAGEPLFNADDQVLLLQQVHSAEFRPFAAHLAIPPALVAIVKNALQRRPPERFGSAAEFAKALRTFLLERRFSVEASDVRSYLETGASPEATPVPGRQAGRSSKPVDEEALFVQEPLSESLAMFSSSSKWEPAFQPPSGFVRATSESTGSRRRWTAPLAALLLALGLGVGLFVWRRSPQSAPPIPIAAGFGGLTVRTHPSGLKLLVDGKPVGRSPILNVPLFPGHHQLTIQAPSRGERRTDFQIQEGLETILSEAF